MKDKKLKIELATIICNEKFNTKKLQKIWKLIEKAREEERDRILNILADYKPSKKSIVRCPIITRELIVRLPSYIKEIEKKIK